MAEFTPIAGDFAAECADVDLGAPLTDQARDEIVAAMDRYGVCIFRNVEPVADDDHLAFGRAFGPLMRQRMQQTVSGRGIRLSTDELIDVGNLDENGNIHAADDPRRKFHKGNLLWHSDVTFDPIRATYSLLAAHVVPPDGADTEFADMKAAYDDLPDATKQRIDGLTAEHSIWYSRKLGGMDDVSDEAKATRPPARHPLVNVNPRTGRKSLYLASHASHIVELPEPDGRALLDELTGHATQRKYVYRHKWETGDVVMWDNLQTMHRGVPFDDVSHPRDMRRVTVLEGSAA
ncbi:MAG: TauD/TfdA dioxygenase family protein [Alphaproteobacteria bacterium]